MKSPIFSDIRAKMLQAKDEISFPGTDAMKQLEQKAAEIVSEHKDALVAAWMAETGLKPSESVICSGFRGNHWRCWVESKDDFDRRAVAGLFFEEARL